MIKWRQSGSDSVHCLQPEPIKNLNDLVKAQLAYHTAAAEALGGIQDDIEELSVAAEGDYRCVSFLSIVISMSSHRSC